MKEVIINGYKLKEIPERNINWPMPFQNWRVTTPEGYRKYFSTERTARTYINIVKGN